MTQRNEALVTAFEQAANRMMTTVESLSDAEWGAAPTGETRTTGQIACHMAEIYHNVDGFIQLAVSGQPLPALTMENIDSINAKQSARYAGASRAAALELLRRNSAATAATLRTLSDAQLDTGIEFLGNAMTVESLVQNGLVAHSDGHLASIQSVATAA